MESEFSFYFDEVDFKNKHKYITAPQTPFYQPSLSLVPAAWHFSSLFWFPDTLKLWAKCYLCIGIPAKKTGVSLKEFAIIEAFGLSPKRDST